MSQKTPTVQQIGASFVTQYYHTLTKEPDQLYRFYKEESSITYGAEADSVVSPVTGLDNINSKIKSLEYRDSKVKLSVVDCLRSYNECILVVVIGFLSTGGSAYKKFTQTFVLAEQFTPKGYYVLNDVFRYFSDTKPQHLATTSKKGVSQPFQQKQDQRAQHSPVEQQQNIQQNQQQDTNNKVQTSFKQSEVQISVQNERHSFNDNLSDGAPSEADSTAATAGTSVVGVEDSMHLSDGEVADSQLIHSKPRHTGPKSISSLSSSSSKSETTKEQSLNGNANSSVTHTSTNHVGASKSNSDSAQKNKITTSPTSHFQTQSSKSQNSKNALGSSNVAAPASPKENSINSATPVKKQENPKSYAAAVGGEDYETTPTSPNIDGEEFDRKKDKNKRAKYPHAVFVSKISPSTNSKELEEAFKAFGTVLDISNMAKQYAYAFVYYENAESVQRAVRASGSITVQNRNVRVEEREDKGFHKKGAKGRGGFRKDRSNGSSGARRYNQYRGNSRPQKKYAQIPNNHSTFTSNEST